MFHWNYIMVVQLKSDPLAAFLVFFYEKSNNTKKQQELSDLKQIIYVSWFEAHVI